MNPIERIKECKVIQRLNQFCSAVLISFCCGYITVVRGSLIINLGRDVCDWCQGVTQQNSPNLTLFRASWSAFIMCTCAATWRHYDSGCVQNLPSQIWMWTFISQRTILLLSELWNNGQSIMCLSLHVLCSVH